MNIRTVWGDHLPEEIPAYPALDLSQRLPWQEIDAVLISKDLLYRAKEDEKLKQQLRVVLAVDPACLSCNAIRRGQYT